MIADYACQTRAVASPGPACGAPVLVSGDVAGTPAASMSPHPNRTWPRALCPRRVALEAVAAFGLATLGLEVAAAAVGGCPVNENVTVSSPPAPPATAAPPLCPGHQPGNGVLW